MKSFLPRLLLISLGLLCLAGCISSSGINSINLGITEIARGANADELRVKIFYSNENVIPIAIERTIHKIYLDGALVGEANSRDPVGLPPAKTTASQIILVIKDKALLDRLISKASSQGASYRIESKLFILNGEEKITAKQSGTGSIDLRALATP